MPVFDFTSPAGQTYSVTGPQGATPAQAFAILQSHLQAAPAAPAQVNPDAAVNADNLIRSAAHGIPIVGGLTDKFAAGMDALTQPILGRGSDADTISDRYAENIAKEQAHSNAFDQAHPVLSTGAELAGGLGALGTVAKTATGARLLGLTGQTLPQQIAQGALSGAALNATDAAVRGDNPFEAGETGALIGGVSPIAGRAIGAATRGITSAIGKTVEPFTEAGREAKANRIISEFSQGAPANVAPSPLSGSAPTAAQATANPGLAALERQLRNMPGEPTAAFTARDAANTSAREGEFGNLSGDAVTLDNLKEQRSQDAEQRLKQVFGSAPQVDPSGVVDTIDKILASKAGQRDAVKTALGTIRKQIVLPDGALQTDAEQLYGIRQNASDKMKFSGSAEKLASSELINVQKSIDGAIEKKVPGYTDYLKTFSDQSKPIDVQQLLQSANVTDSSGKITLGKLDSFIKNVERSRAQPGANPTKSLTDDQLSKLKAIRDDLRMAGNSSLGKAIGSNTVQNLMSSGAIESMLRNQAGATVLGGLLGYGADVAQGHGTPEAGALGGAILGGLLGGRFHKSDAAVIDKLVAKMLNPNEAIKAISGTAANKQATIAANELAKRKAANLASILARGSLPAFAYGPQSRTQQ